MSPGVNSGGVKGVRGAMKRPCAHRLVTRLFESATTGVVVLAFAGWFAPICADLDLREEPPLGEAPASILSYEAAGIESLLTGRIWETPEEREQRIFRQMHPYLESALLLGEHLEFSVRYGPIRAGVATMSIAELSEVAGDTCFHIVTTARSSDFFSTFFYVNDRVESYIHTGTLLPLRFEKHLIEGDFRDDEVVLFDHDSNLAIYEGAQYVEILPQAHDILSAFYSVRARDLEPGDVFNLESHVDGKNYPIQVIVHRRERVSVPVGEFDCVVIEPMLRTPGLFKHEGQLLVWLTEDGRRIPVQMKSKLAIGSISVVLTGVAGRPDWDAS